MLEQLDDALACLDRRIIVDDVHRSTRLLDDLGSAGLA